LKFEKYMHIEKFKNEEVEGIEFGKCYIFPKLDGTNASVWYDDEVCAGSRKRQLFIGKESDNAGFCNYVLNDGHNLRNFVTKNKHLRLFGEWLVPHTFKKYKDYAWYKFYVFDVYSELNGRYLKYEEYKQLLDDFNIDYIPPLCIMENPTETNLYNELKNNCYLVKDGYSCGEGIVIKNYDFKNKFGRITWAKIITKEFRDTHGRNNPTNIKKNKHTVEQEICDNYITDHLVNKVHAKIVNEMNGWNCNYIPRLFSTVYYDMINEEMWDIVKKYKKPTIDFKRLNSLVIQKIKEIKTELFQN